MGAIVDFFIAISEPVLVLIDWVTGFIADIAYMIAMLHAFMSYIPSFFAWLPASISVFIITAFTIVIVYKVIGREG